MFHLKTLQRYAEAQDQTLLTSRFEALQRYKAKAFEIQKLIEQKYQEGFLRDIFVSALGYTLQPDTPYNLAREEKNEQDAKKADGSIIVDGHIIALIELKDLSTKDLDRAKTRNDKSAVEQLFGYVTSHNHARYGIVSNFNELRFYFDKKTEYRRFELFSMEFEEFKVFHLLLSFESIKNGVPLTLKEESASEEQKISKTLYSDFSIFRTHLFENILKNNDMERSLLLRLTQKLCDRIIFILFAEDRALLKKETIKEIRTRHANDGFGDRSMYDYYKLYFNAINMGNDKLGIPKYNGGLFATDELMDSLIIDDAYLDVEVQGLSNYNFMTDIGVNILGHIFEQSLTDLEELNASINDMEFDKKKSKRKKDGVFYTPEYITRYIVENTLGRLCADKRHQLALDVEVVPPVNFKKLSKIEQTIFDNLKAYRTWLLELKICDPACGSGAFLNQALEFLIREHKNVDEYRRLYESEALTLYDIETNILEHNLYGVDINEDAVEIARLSLWLRTAHKGRELTSLNDKIVCANSLLAMPFEKNSFDVVIGNPPYVALNKIKDVDYSHSGFEVFEKTGDLLALFIEKGLGLTADGKYFSFIVSNSWLKTKYGEPLKRFLEKNGQTEVFNFVGTQLFEDATVESCIVNAVRHSASVIPAQAGIQLDSRLHGNDESITITNIRNFTTQNASVETLIEAIENSSGDNGESLLMRKIESIGKPLKEWDVRINYGIKTGFNEAFIIDTAKRDELVASDPTSAEIIKPILRGRDIQKYTYEFANKWMIITKYESNHYLQEKYPEIYNHLVQYKLKLRARGQCTNKNGQGQHHWLELDNNPTDNYLMQFEKEKILWGEISDKPKFSYENDFFYTEATTFFMTGENLKYLLAFLNSKLSKWYFERISTTTGMGTNRWKKFKLELLPIAIADNETPFINLVDEILSAKETLKKYKKHFDSLNAIDKIEIKEETEKLEARVIECEKDIDAMVYALYGLSEDEIAIVEGRR